MATCARFSGNQDVFDPVEYIFRYFHNILIKKFQLQTISNCMINRMVWYQDNLPTYQNYAIWSSLFHVKQSFAIKRFQFLYQGLDYIVTIAWLEILSSKFSVGRQVVEQIEGRFKWPLQFQNFIDKFIFIICITSKNGLRGA